MAEVSGASLILKRYGEGGTFAVRSRRVRPK